MNVESADNRILRLAFDDAPPPPPDEPAEDEGDGDGPSFAICNHLTLAVPFPTMPTWIALGAGLAVAVGVGLTFHDLLSWLTVWFFSAPLAMRLLEVLTLTAVGVVAGGAIGLTGTDPEPRWRVRWALLAAMLMWLAGFVVGVLR